MKKQNVSWRNVDSWCDRLAEKISKDFSHDSLLDMTIVGVSRGGLPIATMLAHRLDIDDVGSISCSSYQGREQGHLKILRWPHPVFQDEKKFLLIVDDIYDSGNTLRHIQNHYDKMQKARCAIFTASLVYRDQEYRPSFYGVKITHNKWLTFPWEKKDE